MKEVKYKRSGKLNLAACDYQRELGLDSLYVQVVENFTLYPIYALMDTCLKVLKAGPN